MAEDTENVEGSINHPDLCETLLLTVDSDCSDTESYQEECPNQLIGWSLSNIRFNYDFSGIKQKRFVVLLDKIDDLLIKNRCNYCGLMFTHKKILNEHNCSNDHSIHSIYQATKSVEGQLIGKTLQKPSSQTVALQHEGSCEVQNSETNITIVVNERIVDPNNKRIIGPINKKSEMENGTIYFGLSTKETNKENIDLKESGSRFVQKRANFCFVCRKLDLNYGIIGHFIEKHKSNVFVRLALLRTCLDEQIKEFQHLIDYGNNISDEDIKEIQLVINSDNNIPSMVGMHQTFPSVVEKQTTQQSCNKASSDHQLINNQITQVQVVNKQSILKQQLSKMAIPLCEQLAVNQQFDNQNVQNQQYLLINVLPGTNKVVVPLPFNIGNDITTNNVITSNIETNNSGPTVKTTTSSELCAKTTSTSELCAKTTPTSEVSAAVTSEMNENDHCSRYDRVRKANKNTTMEGHINNSNVCSFIRVAHSKLDFKKNQRKLNCRNAENNLVSQQQCTNNIVNGQQLKKKYSRSVNYSDFFKDGKLKDGFYLWRKNKKLFVCMYCKRIVCGKSSRHMVRRHSNQQEIKEILKYPNRSPLRRKLWVYLGQKGNYYYNLEVMRRGYGLLIPNSVPQENLTPEDYEICEKCLGLVPKHISHKCNKFQLNSKNLVKANTCNKTLDNSEKDIIVEKMDNCNKKLNDTAMNMIIHGDTASKTKQKICNCDELSDSAMKVNDSDMSDSNIRIDNDNLSRVKDGVIFGSDLSNNDEKLNKGDPTSVQLCESNDGDDHAVNLLLHLNPASVQMDENNEGDDHVANVLQLNPASAQMYETIDRGDQAANVFQLNGVTGEFVSEQNVSRTINDNREMTNLISQKRLSGSQHCLSANLTCTEKKMKCSLLRKVRRNRENVKKSGKKEQIFMDRLKSKVVRRYWTEAEKSAALRRMAPFIERRRVPKKDECMAVLWEEQALERRSWRELKHWVHNTIMKERNRNKRDNANRVVCGHQSSFGYG